MLYMGLKRHEMEAALEADLLSIAEPLIPEDPEEGDLKVARDYFPGFFGGVFPCLSAVVDTAEGVSVLVDQPDRPAVLTGRVIVFERSIPSLGVMGIDDDNTGPAKRKTRRIRGEFLNLVFKNMKIGPYFSVLRTRAGDSNEVGNVVLEEGGQNANILWLDQIEYEVSI